MFKTRKADARCRLSQQGLHQAQQGTVWVLTSPNNSAVLTFFPGGCRVYPYYGIFYRTNSQWVCYALHCFLSLQKVLSNPSTWYSGVVGRPISAVMRWVRLNQATGCQMQVNSIKQILYTLYLSSYFHTVLVWWLLQNNFVSSFNAWHFKIWIVSSSVNVGWWAVLCAEVKYVTTRLLPWSDEERQWGLPAAVFPGLGGSDSPLQSHGGHTCSLRKDQDIDLFCWVFAIFDFQVAVARKRVVFIDQN